MYNPKESEQYPNYFIIPPIVKCISTGGHTTITTQILDRYVISREGVIITIASGKTPTGTPTDSGYYEYALISNAGKDTYHRRHRLLCQVFKPLIGSEHLVVDHINGIKSDDNLDNLEWVTQQVNIERAGAMGLTPNCTPIEVLDVHTNSTTSYPSMIAYAYIFGYGHTTISRRVSLGSNKIWPPGHRYRSTNLGCKWEDISNSLIYNDYKLDKSILTRNIVTLETKRFSSITSFAKLVNMSATNVGIILSKNKHPLFPGYWQAKFESDPQRWRIVTDRFMEVVGKGTGKAINVVDTPYGTLEVFTSVAECIREMHITKTQIYHMLKNTTAWLYLDRYYFCFRNVGDPEPGILPDFLY